MTCSAAQLPSLLRFVVLTVLLVGCHRDEDENDKLNSRPIERGDTVVVERSAAQFLQGRVLSTSDESLRVEITDGAPITVGRGDAYRVDATEAEWSPEQYGICRVGRTRWVACRVVAVRPNLLVEAPGGERYSVSARSLLRPTAVTRLNIERRFQAAERRVSFAAAIDRAGPPTPPHDWRPTEREPVVARIDDSWRSGRVGQVGDGGFVLALGAEERVFVPVDAVVPRPPYDAALTPGGFVLFPPPAPSEPWPAGRVEAVVGNEAIIQDAAGKQHRLSARRVIPLAE